MEEMIRYSFASDYLEGAHAEIIRRLVDTNMMQTPGYGLDPICEAAKAKIREACCCPGADIFFLVGGTQTNATVIDGMLAGYQGVISASTGHIGVHEAGAIEFGGHKVLPVPQHNGKLTAEQVQELLENYAKDGNREHTVMPGMVYISQPTEFGSMYSLAELEKLSAVCRAANIPLYVDGARLAYALACPDNDVTLPDLAKLCDAFYIGGTKCGALFGEAVVIPQHNYIPHFFTIIKQHGALLAKGRLLGIQFDALFTDGLYEKIGKSAIRYARRIRQALLDNGYRLFFDSPTNQILCIAENAKLPAISEKIEYGFWDVYDDTHTVIRFATSWATTEKAVDTLISVLAGLAG